MLTDVLTVLVGGIAIGSIYAMMAVGFSLLWQTSKTTNFAQGDFATLGGFIFIGFAVTLGLPVLVSFLGTVVVGALLMGYVVRKTVIQKLLKQGSLTLVVATLGLSIVIENGLLVFWTPIPLAPPNLVPSNVVRVAGLLLNTQDIANLVAATSVILALQRFMRRTKLGRALQAVSQNREVAQIIGIDVDRTITVAFIINAVLVSAAGVLLAPIFFVQYNNGLQLSLHAFYAAIIGGYNQIRGAIVGGLLVGILETFTAAYISTQYRTGIVLLVLMIVILFRPEGLLGTKEVVQYR